MKRENLIQSNTITVPPVAPLEVTFSYCKIFIDPKKGNHPPHIHNHFELFINKSGNISFFVKNKIYSLIHGDILFIRPDECHFAVYDNYCLNEHYCIFFPYENNEFLFDEIFSLIPDDENLVRLSSKNRDYILELCDTLSATSKEEPRTNVMNFANFLKMLDIISSSFCASTDIVKEEYSPITDILKYLSENACTLNSVSEAAEKFEISVKTLERYFKTYLNSTPTEYIKLLRLNKAGMLLRQQNSVLDACMNSGFSDCSRFIKMFKNHFGETPLQYKKRFLNATKNPSG